MRWATTALVLALSALTAVALSLGLWFVFSSVEGGEPRPSVLAWSNVWVVFMYAPAMVAVLYLLRREGIELRDLFGLDRTKIVRDSLFGIGITFVFWVALIFSGFAASALVFGLFGSSFSGGMSQPEYPDNAVFLMFSLAGLPLAAGICEEIIYRGYALPRVEGLSGKVRAVLLTSLFFGAQHIAIALLSDWRYALMRGVSLFLVGLVIALVYQRQRRLLPLITEHV